ncbi:helix-turn-helix domain-containing protein [Yaniella sp.]|uniref:helix-turn-helix transcriptional regulator n=1 Tax=Yaniella sp. TaxID=2773929 RepID=UPI00301578C3
MSTGAWHCAKFLPHNTRYSPVNSSRCPFKSVHKVFVKVSIIPTEHSGAIIVPPVTGVGKDAGHYLCMAVSKVEPKITKHDLPRLMTRDEVAEYLDVAPKTLSNWNSAGTGPTPVRYGGRSVKYLPEDVYEWVRSKRAA